MTTLHSMDVLLVEDDAGDVTMIEEAFGEFGIAVRLHVAEDGEQAIEFLRRIGGYADAPRPRLIVLDPNLPRRNGLEVLEELKSDPDPGWPRTTSSCRGFRAARWRGTGGDPGRGGHPAAAAGGGLPAARQELTWGFNQVLLVGKLGIRLRCEWIRSRRHRPFPRRSLE